MPAYVIVEIEVHDAVRYEDYKQTAAAAVAAHGGRYLARGGRTELLEGDRQPARTVILEFPSFEQARAWWSATDYAPAKALRQATATSRMVLVDGQAAAG